MRKNMAGGEPGSERRWIAVLASQRTEGQGVETVILFSDIATELEKAGASHELSRSVMHALELSQQKRFSKAETNSREWMEKRFMTRDDFQKGMGSLGVCMVDLRSDLLTWMFIF